MRKAWSHFHLIQPLLNIIFVFFYPFRGPILTRNVNITLRKQVTRSFRSRSVSLDFHTLQTRAFSVVIVSNSGSKVVVVVI